MAVDLPAPFGPEDRDDLARVDAEVDAAERLDVAVALGHAAQLITGAEPICAGAGAAARAGAGTGGRAAAAGGAIAAE